MSSLTRRQFLIGTAVVAGGGILAACTPKATPAPSQPAQGAVPTTAPAAAKKEPTLIKYHIFWNQPQACEPALRAMPEWQAIEAKGYNIEFGTGRGGDAGRTAVAAGTPPDVGDLGPQYDFALGGKLMDLGPYVDASSIIKPDIFFEGNWKDGQFAGWLHGIPAHECYNRRGLNMNKRMIGEAGLDINNPPQTWDELFEWHKKLTKFDAAGNLVQFGIDPYDAEASSCAGGDGWFWEELYKVKGFDETTGTWNVNCPEFVEAFDMFAEFIRYVKPDNLQGVRSVEGQGTWGGSFNAQVQAMIIEGYWHPGETFKEKPEVSALNVATWVPMPAARKGVKIQTFCGHVSSLFKEGTHAKEAFPVLEMMTCKNFCDIFFNTIGWLPGLKDYVAKADGSKYPGLQWYLDSAKQYDEAYSARRTPISSFVSTKFNQYKEQVYRNSMTAKQAADAWQKDVEGEWLESGWKDKWGK